MQEDVQASLKCYGGEEKQTGEERRVFPRASGRGWYPKKNSRGYDFHPLHTRNSGGSACCVVYVRLVREKQDFAREC